MSAPAAGVGLLFPGQGAQIVGMGRDLAEAFSEVRELYRSASETLGFDLGRACFEGPAETLNRTDVCQPAILVTSLAAVASARARGALDDSSVVAAAGLSLGEYTALTYAGALDVADATAIVAKRGRYMQEDCDRTPSGMASILGLTEAQALEACREGSSAGVVGVANLNCPGQVVISGDKAALAAASEAAKRLGARRVVALTVAGAYHSPLMASAQAKLRADLARLTIRAPRVPVACNVHGRPLRDPAAIREALAAQVTAAVRWEDCLHSLQAAGCRRYLELGPGTVLAGLVKKTLEGPPSVRSIQGIGDLELKLPTPNTQLPT